MGVTLTFLLFFGMPGSVGMLDLRLRDTILSLAEKSPPAQVTELVAIDEGSMEAFGQWPWPRIVLAGIQSTLAREGAAVVAYDIVFNGEDRSSPENVVRMMEDLGYKGAKLSGIPDDVKNYDNLFSHTLKEIPSVLAFYPLTVPVDPTGSAPKIYEDIARAHVVANASVDGLIRKVPLFYHYNNKYWPSLGLLAWGLHSKLENRLHFESAENGPVVKLDGKNIPVSEGLLPLTEFSRQPPLSAKDIYYGNFDPERVKGKAVFIGATAPILGDIKRMPRGKTPGVYAHMDAMESLHSGYILQEEGVFSLISLGFVPLCGFLVFLIFSRLTPPLFPGGLLFTAALPSGATLSALFAHAYISPLPGVMSTGITGVLCLISRFLLETTQKRRVLQAFGSYVSPKVVEAIIEKGSMDFMKGEKKDISVLFSDLRGFTAMSADMHPETVQGILNCYFSPMVKVVNSTEGIVDKFIGDAIMAVWGAPTSIAGHSYHAVLSAFLMLSALEKLNEELPSRGFSGITLQTGIGIHTGMAFVGDMGTKEIRSYTCLGDTVNTASRIEGLCPKYALSLLVSREVRNAVLKDTDSMRFLLVDYARVKGKTSPLPVYMPFMLGKNVSAEVHKAHNLWLDMERAIEFDDKNKAVAFAQAALSSGVMGYEGCFQSFGRAVVTKLQLYHGRETFPEE